MDQAAYSIGVFNSHCERSTLICNLSHKVVLELGPGDSISTAIIAASYGASSTLIDSGNFASKDLTPYLQLESLSAISI